MKKKAVLKGEIHLIPFPFTDLSSSKLRPCIVLASDLHDLVVVFVTSTQPKSKDVIIVEPTKANGIKVPSYIRYTKIATLDIHVSLGKIGVLEKSLLKEVQKRVVAFLG